jgi:hypothetical protein
VTPDQRSPTITSGIAGLVPFARGARGRLGLAALSTAAELVPVYALYRSVGRSGSLM